MDRRCRPSDIGLAVSTDDSWFRPVDIKLGPDGALYIADWYDRQVNHYRNHEGQIDPGDGRIYRLKARDAGCRAVEACGSLAAEHSRAGQAAVRSQQVDAADGPAVDRRPQGCVDRAGAQATDRARNRPDSPSRRSGR